MGYGGNKAACIFEMYLSGISFSVLPDDFLMHHSHPYEEQARKLEVRLHRSVTSRSSRLTLLSVDTIGKAGIKLFDSLFYPGYQSKAERELAFFFAGINPKKCHTCYAYAYFLLPVRYIRILQEVPHRSTMQKKIC